MDFEDDRKYNRENTGCEKRYDTKVVSIYDVIFDSSLKIKDFKEMTDEWLDFIVDCRSGKPHSFDIVIGTMADDQIYNYSSLFKPYL